MLTPEEERRTSAERRRYWDERLETIADDDDEALVQYHADWEAEQDEEWARDQDQKEVFGIAVILFGILMLAIIKACV